MPEPSSRPFNKRAFVALVLALTGMGLPVTGVMNHELAEGPMTVARHVWMSAHNVLGILFVVFATWHVVLIRRALLGYFRGAGAGLFRAGREFLCALALVAAALLFFVGHAFIAG